jgi:hypothetical protein
VGYYREKPPFDAWRKKTAPLTQGEQAMLILSRRVPLKRDERIEGYCHGHPLDNAYYQKQSDPLPTEVGLATKSRRHCNGKGRRNEKGNPRFKDCLFSYGAQ